MIEAIKHLVEMPPMDPADPGITGRDWSKTARFYKPSAQLVAHDTPARGILPHASKPQPNTQAATPAPASKPKPAAKTTGKTARKSPTQATKKTTNDLTEIKGIGPAAARDLNAAGIKTFADLASADPGPLAGRMPGKGHSREKLAGWVEQARAHIDSA